MYNSFIPLDLAVAPNPLGLSANLKLATIPIDAYTFFECWEPSEKNSLIAEEVMLLRDDRSRLEEICGKLTWLLGAAIVGNRPSGPAKSLSSWQQVQEELRKRGIQAEVITIEFFPQAIFPSGDVDEMPTSWTIQPLTWHIAFWRIDQCERGYQLMELPFKLSICYGPTITKPVESPAVGVRSV